MVPVPARREAACTSCAHSVRIHGAGSAAKGQLTLSTIRPAACDSYRVRADCVSHACSVLCLCCVVAIITCTSATVHPGERTSRARATSTATSGTSNGTCTRTLLTHAAAPHLFTCSTHLPCSHPSSFPVVFRACCVRYFNHSQSGQVAERQVSETQHKMDDLAADTGMHVRATEVTQTQSHRQLKLHATTTNCEHLTHSHCSKCLSSPGDLLRSTSSNSSSEPSSPSHPPTWLPDC